MKEFIAQRKLQDKENQSTFRDSGFSIKGQLASTAGDKDQYFSMK